MNKNKIKIEHISNTYNYGSLMMAVNCINSINENTKNNFEIYVDAKTQDDLDRIRKECRTEKVYMCERKHNNRIIKKVLSKYYLLRDRKIYNNIIILGGDDISEYYGVRAANGALKHIENYSKKINTILLGQTIGPFTGERIGLAKEILNRCKIYTRDDICSQYLKTIGITTNVEGRDLAFLELPKNNNEILEKYNIEDQKYITIVPSGLISCYTDNDEAYISQYVEVLKLIFNKKSLEKYKIVLLPHVLLPEHVDDRIAINKIIQQLEECSKSRLVVINESMLASEARMILGNGLFTITGRMHAAVSTFFMRKPAISLSYSVKYAGVIGDGLDMKELVIEATNKSDWETGHIKEIVLEKVDYILNNYDSLIEKIDKEVSKTTKIVEEQLKDLKKNLN